MNSYEVCADSYEDLEIAKCLTRILLRIHVKLCKVIHLFDDKLPNPRQEGTNILLHTTGKSNEKEMDIIADKIGQFINRGDIFVLLGITDIVRRFLERRSDLQSDNYTTHFIEKIIIVVKNESGRQRISRDN